MIGSWAHSMMENPRRDRVVDVPRIGVLKLEHAGPLELAGLDDPAEIDYGRLTRFATGADHAKRDALSRAREQLVGKSVRVVEETGLVTFDDGSSLNRWLLREGLALLRADRVPTGQEDVFSTDARIALEGRRGLLAIAEAPLPPVSAAHNVAGMSMPLHSADPAYDYGGALEEIARTGANWVSLPFSASLGGVTSTSIDRTSRQTPPDERILVTILRARELGLRVLLMPILLIRDPGPDDWRGVLRPADRGEWFREYTSFLLHYADLARVAGADALVIGSELCSLEEATGAWRTLIRSVRGRFPGWLTYSANWDHYDVPAFWSELDFIGMTAYHSIASSEQPSVQEMRARWRVLLGALAEFSHGEKKRIVFTEIGYPSLDGGAKDPWDYTKKARVDLREQRDAFEALALEVRAEPSVLGLFVYEWWGAGGPLDRGYSPRGKPALDVICDLYASLKERME